MVHPERVEPMRGVRCEFGVTAAGAPISTYQWTTDRGAQIALSLSHEQELTHNLRQFAENQAHHWLDETDGTIGGFGLTVNWPPHYAASEP